jgi:YHS domain-containing protein
VEESSISKGPLAVEGDRVEVKSFNDWGKQMIKKTWASVLVGAILVLGAAAVAGAHEKKTGKATGDMMNGCGEHHSAAMKASDEVSMHLAEAKRSTTLAEMRTHVEMADKAMAAMKNHMSMCMETMDKMHGDMMSGEKKTAAKMTDPVCNMAVDTASAFSAMYKGKTYYFCSEEDKQKFEKNPEQYVGKKS